MALAGVLSRKSRTSMLPTPRAERAVGLSPLSRLPRIMTSPPGTPSPLRKPGPFHSPSMRSPAAERTVLDLMVNA